MHFARHSPSVPGAHGGRRSKWEPVEKMLGDPGAGPRGEEDTGEEGAVLGSQREEQYRGCSGYILKKFLRPLR